MILAARVAVLLAIGALAWRTSYSFAADEIDPQRIRRVAAKVDELLRSELSLSEAALLVDDETFLRRASLDIVGQLPSPNEITRFVLDPSSEKRSKLVDTLLSDRQYGKNWAEYWRDVILYRRSDERALIVARPLVQYLAKQLNESVPWDEIARSFVTATGDVRENGATAIIMAQMADPSDTTAEMSRVFLGVQIQCAQCHHHPTDRWRRQQFHELAAFFPRIGIRPVRDAEPRSFQVVSFNKPAGRRAPGATEGTELEHFMPDLENPDAKGERMRPVFFATGQSLPLGINDLERRQKLAEWMTAPANGWFAKAIVNRMWGELVGRGFFDPVDDLGPDRTPSAPKTLNYLAREFVVHKHDLKWLIRTIAATEAYQRVGRSKQDATANDLLANCPRRVRADVLLNNLVESLEMDDSAARQRRGRRGQNAGPRAAVNQTFGFDPSIPRDDLAASIPQALFLMNSPELSRAINGRRPASVLGRLLSETSDNRQVVAELYLRILGRQPRDSEAKKCLAYVAAAPSRPEGFEDVVWSLVNSTEFLYRN